MRRRTAGGRLPRAGSGRPGAARRPPRRAPSGADARAREPLPRPRGRGGCARGGGAARRGARDRGPRARRAAQAGSSSGRSRTGPGRRRSRAGSTRSGADRRSGGGRAARASRSDRSRVSRTVAAGRAVVASVARAMTFARPGGRCLRIDHPTRRRHMPAPTLVTGAPCWIDLYSSDTDKATEFYRDLFGWSAEPPQEGFGGYFTFTKDGKHVAGCMRNDGEQGYPDAWGIHLMTDDVEAVAKRDARARRLRRVRADGRRRERQLHDAQGSGRRPRRRLAAEPAEGLRGDRRGRDAGLVRAPHARVRADGRVLPRRVRLGHAHGERHRRVPLHDARRGRGPARRDHGRLAVSRRRRAGALGGLLRRERRRRGDRRRSRSSAAASCARPRTRRTVVSRPSRTRQGRSSASSPATAER